MVIVLDGKYLTQVLRNKDLDTSITTPYTIIQEYQKIVLNKWYIWAMLLNNQK